MRVLVGRVGENMGISYLGYKRRLCSSSFDQVGDHLSPTVVRGGGGLPPPPAPPRMRGAFGAQQCAVGARAPNGAQQRLRRGAFGAGAPSARISRIYPGWSCWGLPSPLMNPSERLLMLLEGLQGSWEGTEDPSNSSPGNSW